MLKVNMAGELLNEHVLDNPIPIFKNRKHARNHARNASLDNPSLHHMPTHDGTHATHKSLGLGPNGAWGQGAKAHGAP